MEVLLVPEEQVEIVLLTLEEELGSDSVTGHEYEDVHGSLVLHLKENAAIEDVILRKWYTVDGIKYAVRKYIAVVEVLNVAANDEELVYLYFDELCEEGIRGHSYDIDHQTLLLDCTLSGLQQILEKPFYKISDMLTVAVQRQTIQDVRRATTGKHLACPSSEDLESRSVKPCSPAGKAVVIQGLPLNLSKAALELQILKSLKVNTCSVDVNPSAGIACVTLNSTVDAETLEKSALSIFKASRAFVIGAENAESCLDDLVLLVDNISLETSKEALWCWLKLAVGHFPHTICYSAHCVKAIGLFSGTGTDMESLQNFSVRQPVDDSTLQIKVLRQTLRIQMHKSGVSEATLRQYFESPRGNGTMGCVQDIAFKDGSYAVITFKSKEALDRALSHKHIWNGTPICTCWYYDELGFTPEDNMYTFADIDNTSYSAAIHSDVTLPQLIVTGFSGNVNDKILKKYFETRSKSGGGDVKSFTKDGEKATITFADAEVADRVYQKFRSEGLKLGGCLLTVVVKNLKMDPNGPRDKLLFKNIGEASKDSLKFFLWAVCQAPVSSVQFAKHKDSQLCVLVSFEEPPDFYQVYERLKAVTLDSVHLEVLPLSKTKSVLVRDVPADAHADFIEIAFENEKRSVVSTRQLSNSTWVVEFSDASHVDSVLTESIMYNGSVALSVAAWQEYEVMDSVRERGKRGRRELQIDWVPVEVAQFVRSKRLRDFEHILGQFGCAHKVESNRWVVTYDLLPSDPRYLLILKQWGSVAEACRRYLADFTSEFVPVFANLWAELEQAEWLKELNELVFKDELEVSTRKDASGSTVVHLTGLGSAVGKAKEILHSKIKAINEDMERRKMRTSSTVSGLSDSDISFLKATGFEQHMQTTHRNLSVGYGGDGCDAFVAFEGLPDDIQQSIGEMKARLKCAVEDSFSATPALIALVAMESVRRHIDQKLAASGLANSTIWSVKHNQKSVCTRALGAKAAREAVALIQNELVDKTVPLDDDAALLLDGEPWAAAMKAICSAHGGDIVIQAQRRQSGEGEGRQLIVACKSSVSAAVLEEMHHFLRHNTLKHDFVRMQSVVMSYVMCHLTAKIEEIENKQLHNLVKVQCVALSSPDAHDGCGFRLEGNADGVANVKRALIELPKKAPIITKEHTLDAPGVRAHFSSNAGKEALQSIGRVSSTQIEEYKKEVLESVAHSAGSSGETLVHELPGGVQLCVIKGDMTKLQCDVIVNAANERLAHDGGLARAIADAGGAVINQECKEYILKHGLLDIGEAMATKAGNLPCKLVVHAVGPRWQGGDKNEVSQLYMAVKNSLRLAAKGGHGSIALPAISAGIFGYPMDRSTKTIVETVKEFVSGKADQSLKKFIFVDNQDKGVAHFKKAVDAIFKAGGTGSTGSAPATLVPHLPAGPAERRGSTKTPIRSSLSQISQLADLVQGSLIDQSVEVLVNSVPRNLDLNTGILSTSLLRAAGPAMQAELHASYPQGIRTGGIAVSAGHALRCKVVLHACCISWDNKSAEQMLQQLVFVCLQEADSRGHTSIAVPAIGTGNLRFPHEIVARATYEAVRLFRMNHPKSTLRTIKLVVFDPPTVTAFKKVEQEISSSPMSALLQSRGQEVTNELWMRVDGSSKDNKLQLGNVSVEVIQGDISEESTSIVVNSTDKTLSFQGQVGRVLASKGGPSIQEECRRHGQLDKSGVLLTRAGQLKSEYVLHVDSTMSCKKTIQACLAKANEVEAQSIAFPAIGTGTRDKNPSEQATSMLEAIAKFISSDKNTSLRVIKFVIFEPAMLTSFQAAMDAAFAEKSSVWKKVTGAFGSLTATIASKFQKGDTHKRGHHVEEETVAPPVPAPLVLSICSASDDQISDAIKMLKDHCRLATVEKTIAEPWETIAALSDSQVQQITTTAAMNDVLCSVDRKKKIGVYLSSMDRLSVFSVAQTITELIFKQSVASIKDQEAAKTVQWQYMDQDNGWQNYSVSLNRKLEDAYSAGTTLIEYTSPDGTYIVDLSQLKDYSKDDPRSRVDVQRRLASMSIYPPEWTAVDTYAEVPVKNASKEYCDVIKNFIGFSARNLEVTRIQNPTLWQQYMAHKKKTQDTLTPGSTLPIERQLWHGAPDTAITSICQNGFNRSYSGRNAVVYGQGAYFARDAKYSANDTYSVPNAAKQKFIIYSLVLTGEFTLGNPQLRVPPAMPGQTGVQYHSTVDNVANPSIFVTYQDSQAYPAYVIKFCT